MAPTKQRRRGPDRGEVLVDLAVRLADGGETISDVAVLRDQPDLFGAVASHATVWRTLDAVDDAALARIKTARADARKRAWAAGADPGFYVIDLDATLVGAHEDPHPGAQLTFTDINGHRFQVFVTDLADPDIAYLEALYRGHGRAERQICDSKAHRTFEPALLLVPDQPDLAPTCALRPRPSRLVSRARPRRQPRHRGAETARYTLFHTAGRITTTSRQRTCRLADNWPWTTQLINAFTRVDNLRLQI